MLLVVSKLVKDFVDYSQNNFFPRVDLITNHSVLNRDTRDLIRKFFDSIFPMNSIVLIYNY